MIVIVIVYRSFCGCYRTETFRVSMFKPLPLSGLYGIRAQNGYGQNRPCKIVLLTLVTPRGVTDLYLSRGIHVEHARTAYHKAFGTTVSINNHIVDM